MLGFIIAFWAAPTMTAGHLLFALATTGYILIALRLEEHDLTAALGDQYRQYRRGVPILIPGLQRPGRRIDAENHYKSGLTTLAGLERQHLKLHPVLGPAGSGHGGGTRVGVSLGDC